MVRCLTASDNGNTDDGDSSNHHGKNSDMTSFTGHVVDTGHFMDIISCKTHPDPTYAGGFTLILQVRALSMLSKLFKIVPLLNSGAGSETQAGPK